MIKLKNYLLPHAFCLIDSYFFQRENCLLAEFYKYLSCGTRPFAVKSLMNKVNAKITFYFVINIAKLTFTELKSVIDFQKNNFKSCCFLLKQAYDEHLSQPSLFGIELYVFNYIALIRKQKVFIILISTNNLYAFYANKS